jgi:ribonuclease T1
MATIRLRDSKHGFEELMSRRSQSARTPQQLIMTGAVALLLLVAAAYALLNETGPAQPDSIAPRAGEQIEAEPPLQAEVPAQARSGLPTVHLAELPPEAHETYDLIESNGPFPYRQDGATFQNREQLLPKKAGAYYREYTVVTPGEGDRGARRIVAGRDGERYYTDDHYASFWEIVP